MHGNHPQKTDPHSATTPTRWWPRIAVGILLLCILSILLLKRQGRGNHASTSTPPAQEPTAQDPLHPQTRANGRSSRPVERATPAMRDRWIAAIRNRDPDDPWGKDVTAQIDSLTRLLAEGDPATGIRTVIDLKHGWEAMHRLGKNVGTLRPADVWEWYGHIPADDNHARAAFLCGAMPGMGENAAKAWEIFRTDFLRPSFEGKNGELSHIPVDEELRNEIIFDLAGFDPIKLLSILREGERMPHEYDAVFHVARFPDYATAVREMEGLHISSSLLKGFSLSPARQDPLPAVQAILAGNIPADLKNAGAIIFMERCYHDRHPDTARIAEMIPDPALREEALRLIRTDDGRSQETRRTDMIDFAQRHAGNR